MASRSTSNDREQNMNGQRCQPCTLSGKETVALFVCQDCPSPRRYWCGTCKGGHDLFAPDHRIILLSVYEADRTKYPLSGDDTCKVAAHAGQKFTLVCTTCDELLCATCAHGSCSKSTNGKHNSEPLENVTKQRKERLRAAIQQGHDRDAKNIEAVVKLQQQKQELTTTSADFNTDVDAAALRTKHKGDGCIRPFIVEVDRRLVAGEVYTDNRRNVQVEAEALLECKNDVEVFRKATAITAQLEEKPVEALPALPTLKFIPADNGEGAAAESGNFLGDIKWVPPISHRKLPKLPAEGKLWNANDCSSIPSGDSSYSVVEVLGVKGGGLYVTDGEGERKKINDDVLGSVCTTEDGGAVYTGGDGGIIKMYSIRGEGAELIKEKEVKVGDFIVFGLSLFPTSQNLAAVDRECIYILSSELDVLSTLKTTDLGLACYGVLWSVVLWSVACGPSVDEVFVIIRGDEGKPHYAALINLSTKTVKWKKEVKSPRGVKYVGDVVYCTGNQHTNTKLILLRPTDGKLLQEVECPGTIRDVFIKGPLGTVDAISYTIKTLNT